MSAGAKPDPWAAYADRPNWVNWSFVPRKGQPKPAKLPKNPHKGPNDPGGDMATCDDPSTWGTRAEALAAQQRYRRDATGIEFTSELGLSGIDVDGCFESPDTNEITPLGEKILAVVGGFAERSVNRRGLHIPVIGNDGGAGRNDQEAGVEFYCQGRGFVVTGDHIPGTPATFADWTGRIGLLRDIIFTLVDASKPKKEQPKPEPERASVPTRTAPRTFTNDQVLAKMFAEPNGDKYRRLYSGDMSDYADAEHPNGNHSRADLGFLSGASFYIQDRMQLDSLLCSSGLDRDKWRNRADYRERTITEALNRTTFYSGSALSSHAPAQSDTGTSTSPPEAAAGAEFASSASGPARDCAELEVRLHEALTERDAALQDAAKQRERAELAERKVAEQSRLITGIYEVCADANVGEECRLWVNLAIAHYRHDGTLRRLEGDRWRLTRKLAASLCGKRNEKTAGSYIEKLATARVLPLDKDEHMKFTKQDGRRVDPYVATYIWPPPDDAEAAAVAEERTERTLLDRRQRIQAKRERRGNVQNFVRCPDHPTAKAKLRRHCSVCNRCLEPDAVNEDWRFTEPVRQPIRLQSLERRPQQQPLQTLDASTSDLSIQSLDTPTLSDAEIRAIQHEREVEIAAAVAAHDAANPSRSETCPRGHLKWVSQPCTTCHPEAVMA